MSSESVKLVIMTGPSGSGKNSLIDLYCKEHKLAKEVYREETESKYYNIEIDNGLKSYNINDV